MFAVLDFEGNRPCRRHSIHLEGLIHNRKYKLFPNMPIGLQLQNYIAMSKQPNCCKTYIIQTKVCKVSRKTFFKPKVVPPLGCYQVSKPLMRILMSHRNRYVSFISNRRIPFIKKQPRLPAKHNHIKSLLFFSLESLT